MAHPVEKKVAASSAAAYLIGLACLAILGGISDHPGLVSSLPDVLEPVVLALVPAVGAGIAGWLAPHTPRADD